MTIKINVVKGRYIKVKRKGEKAKIFQISFLNEDRKVADAIFDHIMKNLSQHLYTDTLPIQRRYRAWYCENCDNLFEEKNCAEFKYIKLQKKFGEHVSLQACPVCGKKEIHPIDKWLEDKMWHISFINPSKEILERYPTLQNSEIFLVYRDKNSIWYHVIGEKDKLNIDSFIEEIILKPCKLAFEQKEYYKEKNFEDIIKKYFDRFLPKKLIILPEISEPYKTTEMSKPEVENRILKKAEAKPEVPIRETKEELKESDIEKIPIEEIRKAIKEYDFSKNSKNFFFKEKCYYALELSKNVSKDEIDRIIFGVIKGVYSVKEAYAKLYALVPELKKVSCGF